MTTRQKSDIIEDIYGFNVSEGLISNITNKILPEMEDWQRTPLEAIYQIIFIDAIHYSVKTDGMIKNEGI